MAALLWREGRHVEVLSCDAARIGHHFLCNGFKVSLQVHVGLVVVKVLVDDAMDVHEVLHDGPAEGQRGLDLLTPETAVGHLEGKLTLSIDAVRSLLIVLEEYAECVILPVELLQDVEPEVVFIEVQVGGEQIRSVNAELIAVCGRSAVERRLTEVRVTLVGASSLR